MTPEKRVSGRHPFSGDIELEITITGIKGAGMTHQRAHCLDVSRGGLGFSTAQPLKETEIVKVSLPLKALYVTVPVLAEVLWVKPANHHYRVGLRYVMGMA